MSGEISWPWVIALVVQLAVGLTLILVADDPLARDMGIGALGSALGTLGTARMTASRQ